MTSMVDFKFSKFYELKSKMELEPVAALKMGRGVRKRFVGSSR